MRLTLTKQAEYALRILMWLAEQPADSVRPELAPRHKAAEIAAAALVPPVFATRVLALLQRQGLLRARAGQQGGYTLAQPAEQISLLHVIEAVEGPVGSTECVLRDLRCGSDGYCVLHGAWSAAQEALRRVLAETTLESALGAPPVLPLPPVPDVPGLPELPDVPDIRSGSGVPAAPAAGGGRRLALVVGSR